MPFLEVHDATPDSLCERIKPEYSAFDGYDMDGAAKDAAARWRGVAKEVRFYHEDKPARENKYHGIAPYKIVQLGEI